MLLLGAQTRQGVDRATEKSLLSQLNAKYPQSPETRYLRKLNSGVDTARWKSGSGFPRAPIPAAPRDSIAETVPSPAHPLAEKPFTLQCGAFTQAANAQAMMSTLSKLGLAPETLERKRGGKIIYQVRVGRFTTPEEAEGFARDRLKPERILSQAIPVNP